MGYTEKAHATRDRPPAPWHTLARARARGVERPRFVP